jgi:hypothetical protein
MSYEVCVMSYFPNVWGMRYEFACVRAWVMHVVWCIACLSAWIYWYPFA